MHHRLDQGQAMLLEQCLALRAEQELHKTHSAVVIACIPQDGDRIVGLAGQFGR